MTKNEHVWAVAVVDDDTQMCQALEQLLLAEGFPTVAFLSAEAFLEHLVDPKPEPACIVADVCLPGMSGLELCEELVRAECSLPVVLITAYPDAEMAVSAIRKQIAVNYLVKPFSGEKFLSCVKEALALSAIRIKRRRHVEEINAILRGLSLREQQVLEAVLAGHEAKEIASQLGIGVKMVLRYRLRLLEKFGVRNAVELLRLLSDCFPER